MNKAELESKHIAELHTLAAEAGVSGYRMLRREELIEKLADGGGKPEERSERPTRERKPRERRERAPRGREREARKRPAEARKKPAEAKERKAPEPEPEPTPPAPPAAAPPKPRRKRRRFGRRRKGVGPADLLLPPPGRQALVYGESRAACTALLRKLAAELSDASKGPDPIALLVDPTPEELADWRREAPGAEIVAASKARHASDALAQAARRAEGGEDTILLVDSLSRLEDAGTAQEIFDGGLSVVGSGSLTVVAALERSR
jgi:Rho termination factor, N-terminal domain